MMISGAKVRYIVATGALIAVLCVSSASAQTAAPSGAKLGAPQITAANAAVEPDPGSLFNYLAEVGQTRKFTVVGSTIGAIWGDGNYTSDSALAVAVVHAGMLKVGQAGVITVEIMPGLESYDGVARNGIASRSYGPWDLGYRIISAEATSAAQLAQAPADLTVYRGQNGTVLEFAVTGASEGTVWGDAIYTDDSAIAAAAVHAGLLQPGETGALVVEILPGQDNYGGSVANGVTTGSYGPWSGSFKFLPKPDAKVASKLAN